MTVTSTLNTINKARNAWSDRFDGERWPEGLEKSSPGQRAMMSITNGCAAYLKWANTVPVLSVLSGSFTAVTGLLKYAVGELHARANGPTPERTAQYRSASKAERLEGATDVLAGALAVGSNFAPVLYPLNAVVNGALAVKDGAEAINAAIPSPVREEAKADAADPAAIATTSEAASAVRPSAGPTTATAA